jgi:membrane-bound serine protease (ClpP class)
VFVIGIILIAFEIFVIPGFGVAGILGVVFVFVGLVLSLINNINFDFEGVEISGVGTAITTVVVGVFGGFIISLYLSSKVFGAKSGPFKNMALNTVQNVSEGYVSVEVLLFELKGKTGVAQTVLRPGGKVLVNGEIYDAVAENGFIDKGENILVRKVEATQLYVEILE